MNVLKSLFRGMKVLFEKGCNFITIAASNYPRLVGLLVMLLILFFLIKTCI